MIIFIEDRQLVVDGYKNRFQKAGEILVRLSAVDFIEWVHNTSVLDLASVEAVLIGQCDSADLSIEAARQKLDIPVVALLERRSLELLTTYYHSGVDDVVVKPVHFEELLIRIATIKRRSVQSVTRRPKDQIVVYFDGRDPELMGEQLFLPRRERRILEFLASINGRRVTKAQIFGAVYGLFDEHIEENVIESHISKLRKKLRSCLGFDPINSKRYLGYCLDPQFVTVEKLMPQRSIA